MFLQVLREELDCQMPVEVIYNGPLEMTHEVLLRFEARPVPRTAMLRLHFGCIITHPILCVQISELACYVFIGIARCRVCTSS